MNELAKLTYQKRMAVAESFRAILRRDDNRSRLLADLGISAMPVIIPSLGETGSSNIQDAARRYFNGGEQHVIVPVGCVDDTSSSFALNVLIVSAQDSANSRLIYMNDLEDHPEMGELVEVLPHTKKWIFDGQATSEQLYFQDLLASA